MIIFYDKLNGEIIYRTGTSSVGHNVERQWEFNVARLTSLNRNQVDYIKVKDN